MLYTFRVVTRSFRFPVSSIPVSRFHRLQHFCTNKMGDSTGTNTPQTPLSGTSTPAKGKQQQQKNNNKPAKKEVKILMLHGYTQSGPLFRAKVRALEKVLAKALVPLNLVPNLIYPTAPNRLSPRDIPGYVPSENSVSEEEEIDSWAWFRKDEASGNYKLLKEGMMRIAEVIEENGGGIEGVIGFSQGGCVAGILAAALEEDRSVDGEENEEWAKRLRETNKGRKLKFFVSYSGFWAVPEDLGWLYEPKIRTESLHVLGGLDTVVEEGRSNGLVERCEEGKRAVVVHPGGHYVPVGKEWVMPVAGFVMKCFKEEKKEEEKL
ncbi:putative seine hydrolase [Podospora fimiseda]|uniref:Seine hydrolase n=1 Tax=Podospora fimiseda TaxID=252190 RepID=A0AAN7BPW3_9PEZI|nr:putative seine hydrolase [Podospora fimiseda]